MATKKQRFVVRKRLSLDFFGDDWKDCYINFTPVTYREANELTALKDIDAKKLSDKEREKLAEQTLNMLKDHFVDGKGYTGEAELVDLTADDIVDLPVEIISKAIVVLRGNIDPNLAGASVA